MLTVLITSLDNTLQVHTCKTHVHLATIIILYLTCKEQELAKLNLHMYQYISLQIIQMAIIFKYAFKTWSLPTGLLFQFAINERSKE